MRKFLIASAIAATAVAAPAFAQNPTIIFTNGVYTTPPYTTAQIFQDFNNGAGNNTTYGPLIAGEVVTGDVRSETGNVPGQTVDVNAGDGSTNKYIAIQGSSSYRINLPAPVQFFSFVLGSLDNYNQVTLFFSGGTQRTYVGEQIIGQTGVAFNTDGNSIGNLSGRVSFDAGSTLAIVGAAFSSSSNSLEIDALASAVPEPATWGMMILGFGAIGSQLRSRRQRQAKLAIA